MNQDTDGAAREARRAVLEKRIAEIEAKDYSKFPAAIAERLREADRLLIDDIRQGMQETC